jgi:hypothetical protein
LTVKNQRADVAGIINSLMAEWKARSGMSARQINNGDCGTFADMLVERLPGSHKAWNYAAGHCFVVYRRRCYDSECLRGVRASWELPFMVRKKNRPPRRTVPGGLRQSKENNRIHL